MPEQGDDTHDRVVMQHVWVGTLLRADAMALCADLDNSWEVCVACGHGHLQSQVQIKSYSTWVHSETHNAVRFRYPYPVTRDQFEDDIRAVVRMSVEINSVEV